jgi:hypothetical protein
MNAFSLKRWVSVQANGLSPSSISSLPLSFVMKDLFTRLVDPEMHGSVGTLFFL